MNTETGDLLGVTEGILVHGCNAQGKMGSGVAKAIRARYPEAYRRYMEAYADPRGLVLGRVVWAKVQDDPLLAVANGITQEFYGNVPGVCHVSYAAIREVFRKVGDVARSRGLAVHYPMIGAGLGGGDWDVIRPIIEEELAGVDHRLWVPGRRPGSPSP